MKNQFINYFDPYLTMFNCNFFSPDKDYTEFAIVTKNGRGFPCLHYEVYKFGIRRHNTNNTIYWRCNAKDYTNPFRTNTRCNATVQTKTINGYEMVRKHKWNHSCKPDNHHSFKK